MVELKPEDNINEDVDEVNVGQIAWIFRNGHSIFE